MALGQKEANRIFLVVMGTIAAVVLFAVSVIGYEAYQYWRIKQDVKRIQKHIPPAVLAMTDVEMARDPAQRQVAAKKALALWEKAMADNRNLGDHCYLVKNAGIVAVDAGDLA